MLTLEARSHFHRHGYVVLPACLDGSATAGALSEIESMFPSADEFHSGAGDPRFERFRSEFGGIVDFPFDSVALSLLSVHPTLIELARSLLDDDDLRVYSIEAWAKFTGAANYEQDHHRDYLNHTLLVPSTDPQFRQLELFVYLADTPEDLGPPSFVSTTLTSELPLLPNWYPRAAGFADERGWTAGAGSPDLYEAEHSAAGPAGTVVAYTTGTFHRGR